MDEDEIELVLRLCTKAGMIMEDACALATSLPSSDAGQLPSRIDKLTRAASDITALIAAAKAVTRPD
jgi:hypothetical protein